jgi:hypothetical protein
MNDHFFIFDKIDKSFYLVKPSLTANLRIPYLPPFLQSTPNKYDFAKLRFKLYSWYLQNRNLLKKINHDDYLFIKTSFENFIIDNSLCLLMGLSCFFIMQKNLNHFLFLYPKPSHFTKINFLICSSLTFYSLHRNYTYYDSFITTFDFKYHRFFSEDDLSLIDTNNTQIKEFFENFNKNQFTGLDN